MSPRIRDTLGFDTGLAQWNQQLTRPVPIVSEALKNYNTHKSPKGLFVVVYIGVGLTVLTRDKPLCYNKLGALPFVVSNPVKLLDTRICSMFLLTCSKTPMKPA